MVGMERFIFSSCALVVVCSGRSVLIDGRVPSGLCRLGVIEGIICIDDGVDGVGTLVEGGCAECPPRRELGLRILVTGPPPSDTGSKVDGVRSCPPGGLGIFDETGCDLLVKVKVMAVLLAGLAGRAVLCLILRFRVSLLESKTSPSPISIPEKKSSLADARLAACCSPE